MREQLPKFLQYFSYIPSLISLMIGFVALITAYSFSKADATLFASSLIVALVSLIALIAKIIADEKIKKLRLGINPLYLVKKHPNDLEAQVTDLLNQKFELKNKTSKTAHLEKKPDFHVLDALILFILGVVPGILYLAWYFSQPKQVVYLELDKQK